MSLKDVSATLSTAGSPAILLVHRGTSEVLQELKLVPATEQHRSFIIHTWMNSWKPEPENKTFFRLFEPAIAESRWQDCMVATDEDGYTVYAWVCFDFDHLGLIHCYVIPELRKLRVMTRLIEKVSRGNRFSYARRWPYGAHARVNPYLLKAKTNEDVRSGTEPDGEAQGV